MNQWVDFRALKETVSLEVVLRHYQVKGLRRRRSQLEGCCPIHHGEREDAFHANLRKNIFHCFVCQAGGTVLDFVAAMERCSIREAALRAQAWFGGPAAGGLAAARPRSLESLRKPELVREKSGVNPPLSFSLAGVDSSHPYLRERGIQPATAKQFGVGFYGGRGLLQGRIVIPIRNPRGEIVAYAGRALDNTPPRYKLPSSFRKSLELFNLDGAAAAGSRTVIVVEGYFDCLRVHQSGFPCVVGLMGCALSAEQERLLVNRFERVLLMLDGDVAGRAASGVIRARLSGKCSVAVVPVPDGAQPDQLAPSAIQRLLQSHLEVTQEQPRLFETR